MLYHYKSNLFENFLSYNIGFVALSVLFSLSNYITSDSFLYILPVIIFVFRIAIFFSIMSYYLSKSIDIKKTQVKLSIFNIFILVDSIITGMYIVGIQNF